MHKKFITAVIGTCSQTKYWIVRWDDGEFGWQYTSSVGIFGVDGYETLAEAKKAIEARELEIADGILPMV